MDTKKVIFSTVSQDDIPHLAVCRVHNEKSTKPSDTRDGGMYDLRMGPAYPGDICSTCNVGQGCPGHFGYIELPDYIIFPVGNSTKRVLQMLRNVCCECMGPIPAASDACGSCGAAQPSYSCKSLTTVVAELRGDDKVVMSAADVYTRLYNVPASTWRELNVQYTVSHPKDLIVKKLLVIPPLARPIINTNGDSTDDDLTAAYRDILRACRSYSGSADSLANVATTVAALFDTTTKAASQSHTRQTFKDRINGKEGIFRMFLLGKRTNFSARTVVGGDPTIKSNEVSVPDCIAERVTMAVTVSKYNYHDACAWLAAGQITHITRTMPDGEERTIDVEIATRPRYPKITPTDTVLRDGKPVEIRRSADLLEFDVIERADGTKETVRGLHTRPVAMNIGDKVHRHLMNGDVVVVNRQPSLHVGSMIACRVVRRHGTRAIGIPLNITPPMNCDFDGDEVNMHVPQTLEAVAECQELLDADTNVVSGQSARPIMGLVQDAVVGAYLMTRGWVAVPKHTFNDICVSANIPMEKIEYVKKAYSVVFGDAEKLYTGRGLLSMALPDHFTYSMVNQGDPDDPVLRVSQGVFTHGTINKSVVGMRGGAIHHHLSATEAGVFLTRMQHLTTAWLRGQGVSVGLQDCIPEEYSACGMIPAVEAEIASTYMQADDVRATVSHPAAREARVLGTLNAARDRCQVIAQTALRPDNRFLVFVRSGAKGSMSNVAQITGMLGQQNVSGGRIKKKCIGDRAMTCDVGETYESRGFVKSSFFSGLTAHEFWAHATSGREGIVSTSCTTAKTGYCQHRITEMLKNCVIAHDGSVRDGKRIVQFAYNRGVAPSREHKVLGAMAVPVMTALDRISAKVEWERGLSPTSDAIAAELVDEPDTNLADLSDDDPEYSDGE